MRDYDPKTDRIFIHRLKGSNSGHHHLMREEARALRAWLKVRGSFPGPTFLSKQKRPIDRTRRERPDQDASTPRSEDVNTNGNS